MHWAGPTEKPKALNSNPETLLSSASYAPNSIAKKPRESGLKGTSEGLPGGLRLWLVPIITHYQVSHRVIL